MASVHILYFAALGAKLDCKQETVELPDNVTKVGQLKDLLSQRGKSWDALQDSNIRSAVNQTIAAANTSIQDGDEIAFFPPVTGG